MKRLLSLLVAFAMILSMVPNAFAVEAGEDQLPSDMETIGSLDNPEVLADLGYYSVTLASGDVDGYYYAYTAIADGTVTANVETVTPVVSDDNETEIVAASTEEEEITAAVVVINTATEVSGNEVAVSAGDLVLIQVTASAAASVEWYGAFTYPAGTEQNPIWLEAGENILTIPAGATVYYQGRFGGMVMSAAGEGVSLEHNGTTYALTAEAVEFACVQAGMWSPSIFVLTNAGEADATCMLTVSYPMGTMDNPAALEMGDNAVTLEAGSQGYYFTWTAEAEGTLYILMPEDMDWTYVVNNMTTYQYGDTQWSDSDPVVNPAEIAVAAGDELQIMVNTYDPTNPWNTPAGELVVYAEFLATPGTEGNPVVPEFTWNEDMTEATATVTVPANTAYYFASYDVSVGMLMTANGEAVEITYGNRWMRMPSTWVITNETDADAAYELVLYFPVGSMANPDTLVMGDNVATIAGGEGSEYYYTWTAEADGTLTILMPEDIAWTYTLSNETTGIYGDTQWSDSDPVVNPASITVSAGDEIQLIVATYNADEPWAPPAGEVVVYAEFLATPGTEGNPIVPEFTWNEDMTEATATVTVPANTAYYFASYDVSVGMLMTANGEAVEITYGNRWMRMPSTWVITNETDADAAYELVLYFPVGSMANPDTLVMGDNVATIAGGEGSEYYYTWTAEADGTLTILMPEDIAWTYTLSNETTGIYGDTQWSDSDPVVNPASITVSAGDEIQLIVATYNADEPWAPPAGEVTVTASFKLALEITKQPVDSNSIINKEAVFTVEVSNTAGVSYQWYLSKDNGETWTKSTYTGNKTNTMTITKVYERFAGWQVYCEITDAQGNVLKSDVASVTLKPADIKYVSTTTSGAVAAGKSWVANVKAEATVEGGTIAYRWFISQNGVDWDPVEESIPGYNGNRITITAYASRANYYYRCRLTDADGAYIFSKPVQLKLKENPLTVKTEAADAAVVLNANAVFTFEVDNAQGGTVSYKWFVSTDGGKTWSVPTAFAGVNTSSMTVKAYQSRSGYVFKCMASFSGHKLYSENVTLTVKENPMSITEAPESVTVKAGEQATFHVAVAGNVGELTYTWFTRKTSTGTWSKIAGETTDTLTVSATASKNGYQYFCQVKDSEGNVVKTTAVTLTVN